MTLEKMDALEARVRGLLELVEELRRANQQLQGELRVTRQRLVAQLEVSRRWEDERRDIRSRVVKALDELDLLDCLEDPKEVALE